MKRLLLLITFFLLVLWGRSIAIRRVEMTLPDRPSDFAFQVHVAYNQLLARERPVVAEKVSQALVAEQFGISSHEVRSLDDEVWNYRRERQEKLMQYGLTFERIPSVSGEWFAGKFE